MAILPAALSQHPSTSTQVCSQSAQPCASSGPPCAEVAALRAQVAASLVCGSLAGLVSSTLTFPLDLVRRRLQLEGQAGAGRRCARAV